MIAGSQFASYSSRDTTIFEAFEKWPTQVIEEWNATTECRLFRCHITHEYEHTSAQEIELLKVFHLPLRPLWHARRSAAGPLSILAKITSLLGPP